MITKIDTETVDFLAKKKLTFNQFCICLMIYHKDIAGILKYTHQIGYLAGGTVQRADKSNVNELQDLIDRGFIVHDGMDKRSRSVEDFLVTDKFTKGFLDDFKEKAEAFYKAYPDYILIQGKEALAKGVDYEAFIKDLIKLFKSDNAIYIACMNSIKGQKYAKIGIERFIKGRLWTLDAVKQVQPRIL